MFRLLGVLDWVEMSVQVAAALLDLPQPQAQAALERLVDDHLLDSASPGRYRTHDLLRLYARDLAEHDEPAPHRQAALLRALNCYLAAAEQATLLLNPATPRIPADPTRQRRAGLTLSTPADATTWVDTEHTNLIAAAHQAATAPGTAPTLTGPLTTALYRPFETRGYWHDLIALRCLAAGTAQRLDDRPGEALARQDVGYVYTRLGHPDKAVAATQQALAIFQQTCGRRGEQDCLLVLGIAHRQQHRFAEAITRLQQGLAISRGSRDRYAEAVILNNLGLVYQRLHRFDEAIASHRQAYVTNRELNDRYGEAAALVNLGWAYHRAGHADQAITCYQQSLTITRELGHRYDEAEALWGLGQTHHALGQDDKARTYWQQSITVLHDIGELTDDETNTLLHQPVPGTPTIIQQNI
jgi:tetratricopeptide (TPR) repeat protein